MTDGQHMGLVVFAQMWSLDHERVLAEIERLVKDPGKGARSLVCSSSVDSLMESTNAV